MKPSPRFFGCTVFLGDSKLPIAVRTVATPARFSHPNAVRAEWTPTLSERAYLQIKISSTEPINLSRPTKRRDPPPRPIASRERHRSPPADSGADQADQNRLDAYLRKRGKTACRSTIAIEK